MPRRRPTFDSPARLPGFLRTFGRAAQAWWNDGAARLGASLAYYTLFALAPILLIAIAAPAGRSGRQSFGRVRAIGFLLLVSLLINTAIVAAAGWLERHAPLDPLIRYLVNLVVSVGVITVLFALLFKVLPDVELRWGGRLDRSPGDVAAVRRGQVPDRPVHREKRRGHQLRSRRLGAGAPALGLLLGQILLLGAEYTRVRTQDRPGAPEPKAIAEPAMTP